MDSLEGFGLGWDVRSLYEQPPPDILEAEAFFVAFSRFHNIDGHRVNCIHTKTKRQPIAYLPGASHDSASGVSSNTSVLIVREEDMSGMEQGGSLKIDGMFCRIMSISRPVSGVIRMDLEGYTG